MITENLRNRLILRHGCRSVLGIVLGLLMTVSPSSAQMQGGSASILDSCQKMFSENQEPISLDFQMSPVEDVFKVISDVSGKSIVTAPDVKGNTTVLLTDVPWPVALEVVLNNSKLGRECENNIIRVATRESLRAFKQKGEQVTEMIQLNYSDINEVSTRVKGFLNATGQVTIDQRTNTLVVTDTRPMMEDVLSVIKNLDIQTPQVQIASKIVQVNRNFFQELGIQWGFTSLTFRNPEFPNAILTSGAANSGEGAIPLPSQGGFDSTKIGQADLNQGFNVDLGTTNAPSFGLGTSLLSRDGDLALDVQLSALERQGRSRVISNPKVSTADNKLARIRQGERIPFQTFSANEGVKTEFVDANLELKVTPHITADQNVYLKIEALQDTPDFSNAVGGAPRIDTRRAITELMVKDGGTAILGGLHQRTSADNRRAVPFLADIPIVGLLFKSKLERNAVDELLIFVTPSIIKSSDPSS